MNLNSCELGKLDNPYSMISTTFTLMRIAASSLALLLTWIVSYITLVSMEWGLDVIGKCETLTQEVEGGDEACHCHAIELEISTECFRRVVEKCCVIQALSPEPQMTFSLQFFKVVHVKMPILHRVSFVSIPAVSPVRRLSVFSLCHHPVVVKEPTLAFSRCFSCETWYGKSLDLTRASGKSWAAVKNARLQRARRISEAIVEPGFLS